MPKVFFRLSVLATIFGSLVFGFSAPAAASTSLRGPGVASGVVWFGSYRTFNATPWAWCIDPGLNLPRPQYSWSPTTHSAPHLGYLLDRHHGENTVENHAALSYLIHSSAEVDHVSLADVPASAPIVSGIDIPRRVDALLLEAKRFAGPYSLDVELTPPVAQEDPPDQEITRHGVARVVVRTASGESLPGAHVVISLDGPAQWDQNPGQQDMVVETTEEGATARFHSIADGVVKVQARAEVPASQVVVHYPDVSRVQRVITPGPSQTILGESQTSLTHRFHPVVETKTSHARVELGDEIHDRLTVTSGEGAPWLPGATVSVTSTLYGPLSRKPEVGSEVPENISEVGSVITVVDGPGEFTTPSLRIREPGFYVWRETIGETVDSHFWNGRWGEPEETTLARWVPKISTVAATTSSAQGTVASDRLSVAGLPTELDDLDPRERELTLTLYGPFSQPPGPDSCTAQHIVDSKNVVWHNGEIVVDDFIPVSSAGYYTFVEEFHGSTHIAAHRGMCGATAETFSVAAVATPSELPETGSWASLLAIFGGIALSCGAMLAYCFRART